MIRYVGGKTRLAKEITAVLATYKKPEHQYFLEPFFGGGSIAQYAKTFGLHYIANDSNKDLINFYRLLQVGWLPPEHITEEEYNRLRVNTDTTLMVSAMRGYAGFALSFGGKWFGGYARDPKGGRNFASESYRRLIKHIPDIQDISFHSMDYRLLFPIRDNYLIYCDPPYASTLGYGTVFNTKCFWNTVRNWNRTGATVLISEYNAPYDFEIVWEKPYKTYGITRSETKPKRERLFIWNGDRGNASVSL